MSIVTFTEPIIHSEYSRTILFYKKNLLRFPLPNSSRSALRLNLPAKRSPQDPHRKSMCARSASFISSTYWRSLIQRTRSICCAGLFNSFHHLHLLLRMRIDSWIISRNPRKDYNAMMDNYKVHSGSQSVSQRFGWTKETNRRIVGIPLIFYDVIEGRCEANSSTRVNISSVCLTQYNVHTVIE